MIKLYECAAINEKKKEIEIVKAHEESWVKTDCLEHLNFELIKLIVEDITIKRLEEICNAERDGNLFIQHFKNE